MNHTNPITHAGQRASTPGPPPYAVAFAFAARMTQPQLSGVSGKLIWGFVEPMVAV
jgi:hypothetical protein